MFWRVVDGKVIEVLPEHRMRVLLREEYLAEVQRTGDRIGRDLHAELSLPDDVEVVYVMEHED